MGTHLVERYLPGIDRDGLAVMVDRLAAAAAELQARGVDVHYGGSLFLPEEESCFCRLEAPSIATVAELNRLADAPYARISSAIALGAAFASGPTPTPTLTKGEPTR